MSLGAALPDVLLPNGLPRLGALLIAAAAVAVAAAAGIDAALTLLLLSVCGTEESETGGVRLREGVGVGSMWGLDCGSSSSSCMFSTTSDACAELCLTPANSCTAHGLPTILLPWHLQDKPELQLQNLQEHLP